MALYVANPTSRDDIRRKTELLRELCGLSEELYIPIVELLEFWLPSVDNDFVYEISPVKEMSEEALTLPEHNKIIIREDVYNGACEGTPRDRFTIAHELGHLLMHSPGTLKLARGNEKEIPPFKNPEWQANTFAGELLAPPRVIRGFTKEEIAMRCGVSLTAAEIQLKKL